MCIRCGIQRKIKGTLDVDTLDVIDIILCNNVFNAQCVLLRKRDGKSDA